MKYSFADKKFETAEEMSEYANSFADKSIFCSRCYGHVKKPFATLLIDSDEFVFCDSECLENWIREYRKISEDKVSADNAFDFFIINSISANIF